MHEAVALLCLAASLAAVLARRRAVPEAVVAGVAVGIVVATGTITGSSAIDQVRRVGPVVGFLAAVLVLADGCAADGMFDALGQTMVRHLPESRWGLILATTGLASLTTAVFSLDTTVVLLTPVVLAMASASQADPRPAAYLTGHLANSASVLLPVSNLTNLLAISYLHVSFPRFAALMALPWLVVIAVELLGVASCFAGDLRPTVRRHVEPRPLPRFTSVVAAVTVIGFAISSAVSIAPVWFAVAGATVVSARRVIRARSLATVRRCLVATSPSFCLWVLGVTIVAHAVSAHGLATQLARLVPSQPGLPSLLAVAGVSALLANLVNNLPATLLMIPLVLPLGTGPVLAVLLGVNIGPNLTYPGSLATLLWRRILQQSTDLPRVGEFTRLGAVTVPAALLTSVLALRLSLSVVGH